MAAVRSRDPTLHMRIAHVTDFYLPRLGGIEMHIAGLAEQQRRNGHHVDVVAAGGVAESSDPATQVAVRTGSTFESFRPDVIAPACVTVLAGRYDVVHVHAGLFTPLAFAVASATARARLPTVVTVHSLMGHFSPLYRAIDPLTGWTGWPTEWTAVSHVAAAPLQRLLGTGHTVHVLPNAIDAEFWKVDHVRHDRRRIAIVAVMRLARRKRPMQLLRILRTVRARTPGDLSIDVTIVGEGAERPSMEAYLARHDMARWVHLPGREGHEEIRERFRHADIFVAPAIHESFGIAALEARSSGIPVVAMQRAGIREFIEHGRSGLLVHDDADMVRAITRLVTHPTALESIAAHNRTTPPPFEWSAALELTDQAYRRAGARPQRTSDHSVDDLALPGLHAALTVVGGGVP